MTAVIGFGTVVGIVIITLIAFTTLLGLSKSAHS